MHTHPHTHTHTRTLPHAPRRKLDVWAVLRVALSESQVVTQQTGNREGETATGFKSRWGGSCIKIMKWLLSSNHFEEDDNLAVCRFDHHASTLELPVRLCLFAHKTPYDAPCLWSVVYLWSQRKHIIIIFFMHSHLTVAPPATSNTQKI